MTQRLLKPPCQAVDDVLLARVILAGRLLQNLALDKSQPLKYSEVRGGNGFKVDLETSSKPTDSELKQGIPRNGKTHRGQVLLPWVGWVRVVGGFGW